MPIRLETKEERIWREAEEKRVQEEQDAWMFARYGMRPVPGWGGMYYKRVDPKSGWPMGWSEP